MATQTNDNDRIAFEKVYLLWVKIRKFKERRNKDYRSERIECHYDAKSWNPITNLAKSGWSGCD